jgi:hypothetical protein
MNSRLSAKPLWLLAGYVNLPLNIFGKVEEAHGALPTQLK